MWQRGEQRMWHVHIEGAEAYPRWVWLAIQGFPKSPKQQKTKPIDEFDCGSPNLLLLVCQGLPAALVETKAKSRSCRWWRLRRTPCASSWTSQKSRLVVEKNFNDELCLPPNHQGRDSAVLQNDINKIQECWVLEYASHVYGSTQHSWIWIFVFDYCIYFTKMFSQH